MTDLLQTAVLTGTGRAAQIGRPVAGKTGTTSSNKDGWFLGFSSGITTGVWMGRDDARPIPGLQGGRAPGARVPRPHGTRGRAPPVEPFDTEVTLARLAARARRGGLVRRAGRHPDGRSRRQSDRPRRSLWPALPRRRGDARSAARDLAKHPRRANSSIRNGSTARSAAIAAPPPAPHSPGLCCRRFRSSGNAPAGRSGESADLRAEPCARGRRVVAEQLARPGRGNPDHDSCGRDARPHARRSRGGRSRAPGSAASCSGSCPDSEQLPQR